MKIQIGNKIKPYSFDYYERKITDEGRSIYITLNNVWIKNIVTKYKKPLIIVSIDDEEVIDMLKDIELQINCKILEQVKIVNTSRDLIIDSVNHTKERVYNHTICVVANSLSQLVDKNIDIQKRATFNIKVSHISYSNHGVSVKLILK